MVRAAVPDRGPREAVVGTGAGGRGRERPAEPVWLVRAVLVLFLVGFAAFLAREVANLVRSLT